jgi:hypothetical protein
MLTLKSRVIASAAAAALALSTVGLTAASADGNQYREGYQAVPPAYDEGAPPAYEPAPAYVAPNYPPGYAVPPVRYDNRDGAAAAALLFGSVAAIIASKRHRHRNHYEAYGYEGYSGPGYRGHSYAPRMHVPQGKVWRHHRRW